MKRHVGLIVFGASLVLAFIAYRTLVTPVRREIGSLVERILAVNTAEMADRIERAPGRDDEVLLRLRAQLVEALPSIEDRWKRIGRSRVPNTAGFKALFSKWLSRMQADGILAAGAWPRAPWRTGQALPSLAEKESTARLMLLVEGLGRGLHEEASARILTVTASDAGDEIEIGFEFDPTRAGGLLDTILSPRTGGEIFELLEVATDVAESDAATGRVRLALIDPEG